MPNQKGRGSRVTDEHGLLIKHREVCEHWLADPERNQTAAYEKVYSPNGELMRSSIVSKASALFKRKEVDDYLKMRIKKMMEKYLVTQERIIEEWGYLCFSDPRKLFDEFGNLKLPEGWDDAVAGSIAGIKVSTARNPEGKLETLKEIKFWDKNKALADAGRHLNMFQKDNEASAPKVVPDRLEKARRRAEDMRGKLKVVDSDG